MYKRQEWQDSQKWEWVDTRVGSDENDSPVVIKPLVSEFSLRDAYGDATALVVNAKGRVYMICVTRFDRIGSKCEEHLRSIVERAEAEDAWVVCLTPEYLPEITYHSFGGSTPVKCYNIDATVLKTMLRAETGLVVLDDGTITQKLNCRDIR